MRNLIFSGAAVVVMAMALPAAAQDKTQDKIADKDSGTSWALSTGLDYSSGKYGGSPAIDIVTGLSEISLTTGNFQFAVSSPYLHISGPPGVVLGAGGKPVVVKRKVVMTSGEREGFGDLNLSATYSIQPEDLGGFEADLTGHVKVPTADTSKGLSSGEADFGFSVDISRQIDIWSPFVTFGYQVPGRPTTYSLVSAPSFSVGTSVQLNEKLLAIVSYDFDGTISSSLADSQQMFASLSWLLNDQWTLTAYASLGMSSGAPNQGTGLLIGWKLP